MKSVFQLISFMVTLGYALSAAVAKLPPTFTRCSKSSGFDPCIERAVEKALQELAKGYPPLGIYSIDPLEITSIDIDQGTGPVSVNLKFRNLLIKGLKDTKLNNFKSDFENLKFTGNVIIPKLFLDGKYTINGKVLILPITGDGQSKLTLDDVTGAFVIHGKHFKKDGQTYMKVSKFDFHFDTRKLGMSFTNLFKGDKALGDNMNKFLNENSAEILKELKPAIQDTFGAAFAEIANRIFTKVPFDEIFLKR